MKDTVEVAADTMVVVQSQSDTLLDWFSFVGTAFVAIFTGGYLYYTYKIYQETQKQARSAEQSAEASRKAAKASQESLTEQKRVNDATVESLEKRRIERAHPLLWVDVGLEGSEHERWVRMEIQNQSDLPALDITAHIVAGYSRDYCSWGEFKAEAEEEVSDFFGEDPQDYNFLTWIGIEAMESGTDPAIRFKYPVPPNSLKVLLQYRDIHGENYGRYFWATGVYDNSIADHLTPGSITTYGHSKTVPHSIKKRSRIYHRKIAVDDSVRLVLIRKEDKTNLDLIDTARGYRWSDDKLLQEVGTLNEDLKHGVTTASLRSFQVEVEEQGLFSYSISMPLS